MSSREQKENSQLNSNPHLTIPHWPKEERPRERLFHTGPASLSDAELLALSLRSGTPGRSARDLAFKLLRELDGLPGLARRSPQELLKYPGLGPAKVASLMASFELGSRILNHRIAKKTWIQSASDVLALLSYQLKHEREEVFMALVLNAKNEMIKALTLFRGDPTQVVVSVPAVMRQILREGAVAVIFVHNHPSGDPEPSVMDHRLTKRLLKACQVLDIKLQDHIVVAAEGFFSFAQAGLLK